MTGAAEDEQRTLAGGARKSAARLAAVQALYQIDHSSATSDSVLEQFFRYRLGDSFGIDGEVRPNKNLFSEKGSTLFSIRFILFISQNFINDDFDHLPI